MQLRRLAAMERQRILGRLGELETEDRGLHGDPGRAGTATADRLDELEEISERYGDERRTRSSRRGRHVDPDLIPDVDVVVTISRGGYAKRTQADLFRRQRRGGKVFGARLARRGRDRSDLHHHESSLDPLVHQSGAGVSDEGVGAAGGGPRRPGSHVAGLLSFPPGEKIAQVLTLRDYEQSPYLVLATKAGLVKNPL